MSQTTTEEIPEFFLCPISLQIMSEPVTTITGITYDRESIEKWIRNSPSSPPTLCPVTNQPLARDSDLTPNHTLRRLIEAWSATSSPNAGPTTPNKSPVRRSLVVKLVRDLNSPAGNSSSARASLGKLLQLAEEGEGSRKCMAEYGVAEAMIHYILGSHQETLISGCLELAFRVLLLTWTQSPGNKELVRDNLDLIQTLTRVLTAPRLGRRAKTDALTVLQHVVELASPSLMQKLGGNNTTFFQLMVAFLRGKNVVDDPPATRVILKTLIQTGPYGRNRFKIVEAGAVHDLVEIELNGGGGDKKTAELILGLLASLCLTKEGRQQLLKHAGGLAMVAKRTLRISNAADDCAVSVLESVARFSASPEVLSEMLSVGAVTKLCMVLQADCAPYLKKKARKVLRLHSSVWDDSPCIQVYLLTRYGR